MKYPHPFPPHPAAITLQNITAEDFEAQYIDGDAVVVTNSKWVDIDAGRFDE